MKKLLLSFATVLIVGYQAVAVISSGTRDLANQLGAHTLTEVDFGANNTALSDSHRDELRNIVKEAKQKGKIKEVKVLAWSDQKVSPTKNENKADIRLAKNRMNEIRRFLKEEIDIADVDTYNMAEKPNKLQELLKTSDAQVKRQAEASGAAPKSKDDLGLFGEKSQASKAVVMVFIED